MANKEYEEVSKKLYPEMMQPTRFLLIDYDLTRYHSFELFAYLILEEEYFMDVEDKKFLVEFAQSKNLDGKIRYYMKHCKYFNPLDNFTRWNDKSTTDDLENVLNDNFHNLTRVIGTDLEDRLGVFFQNSTIDGYLLQYANDPHVVTYDKQLVKTYTSDHILDLAMAIAIIKKHNINAIMVSSVDIAVLLMAKLIEQNITNQISFFICTYRYNYDKQGIIRHLQLLNKVEYLRKYEFNVIDPFTGLNAYHKWSDNDNSEQE